MASPIKETSILYGEDAKRFEERMNKIQKETPEQRKISPDNGGKVGLKAQKHLAQGIALG